MSDLNYKICLTIPIAALGVFVDWFSRYLEWHYGDSIPKKFKFLIFRGIFFLVIASLTIWIYAFLEPGEATSILSAPGRPLDPEYLTQLNSKIYYGGRLSLTYRLPLSFVVGCSVILVLRSRLSFEYEESPIVYMVAFLAALGVFISF